MQSVSISELKARLSHYLREVRRGGEIHVLDRGVPIARLSPLTVGSPIGETRSRLVAEGIIRPGAGGMAQVLEVPPLDLGIVVSDVLVDDRADRL